MTFKPEQHCLASLLNIKPYKPGKSADDLESDAAELKPIKLSSNENVLGPSPKAVEAMQQYADEVYLYPGNSSLALKNKLAERHDVLARTNHLRQRL